MQKPQSAADMMGVSQMGMGTGPFKSNISPLIAEQIPVKNLQLHHQKNGELVIIDPALTVARVMMVSACKLVLVNQADQVPMALVVLPFGQLWFAFGTNWHGIC